MNKVTIFLDTEFTNLGQDCDLISIGMVARVNDEYLSSFYAESIEFSHDKCSDFVIQTVLPNLTLGSKPGGKIYEGDHGLKSYAIVGTEEDIVLNMLSWFDNLLGVTDEEQWVAGVDLPIEIWSDVLNYDWTLFVQLFNDYACGLPKFIYYIPFDISTAFKIKGIDPDINREEYAKSNVPEAKDIDKLGNMKHNSAVDALVIYYCYIAIMKED